MPGATRAPFVRVLGVILLLGFAVWVYLGNYELLFSSHAFMTGADYVDEKVTLPLRWLLIISALAALPLVWMSRFKQAVVLVMSCFILQLAAPAIVRAVYVRPNEISIERPYIERHIQATTAAFGLNRNATESPFTPSGQGVVDPVQDATLLANVRLWDLRAYGATITQIQALRPYYTFPDTDVDRYFINGRIKQVLLSPREIDVTQLSAEASESWINPRFIYTHGFGVVVAEVNKITPDGLPVLLIENAPPEIKSPGFQLSRPEIYFGERTQDPVFVHTAREEFDYPSGDQNKYSTYQGTGGFPVGSFLLKVAAAISQGEPNIVFTGYLTGQSRMMIYRKVEARLAHLAGFLHWDQDPYLVITDDGRLVWMVDGYTTSLSHPVFGAPSCGRDRGRRKLHSQCGESYCGCLHGKDVFVCIRSERPDHTGLPEAVPQVIPARVRNARRSAPARPVSGGAFSHPGRGVPNLSYARSAGVLQQGRHLGDRARPVRPVWATRADRADLRRGHVAGGEAT